MKLKLDQILKPGSTLTARKVAKEEIEAQKQANKARRVKSIRFPQW